jgi:SAM-dependent methyltransferase
MISKGCGVFQEEVLAEIEIDAQRRVYLCEFGIVHLKWHENDLVYCPGDFIGLPFLLFSLANTCERECVHGKPYPHEAEDGLVYLPYHSVRLAFSLAECRQMHDLALAASRMYRPATLAEYRRVLRPGGRLIFTLFSTRKRYDWNSLIDLLLSYASYLNLNAYSPANRVTIAPFCCTPRLAMASSTGVSVCPNGDKATHATKANT